MDKKTTDIVAYLNWIGLVIALVAGDREKSRFHLNQSLVIWIAGTVVSSVFASLSSIDYIGWIFGVIGIVPFLFCAACWLIGIVGAIQEKENPVPFLGEFQILK